MSAPFSGHQPISFLQVPLWLRVKVTWLYFVYVPLINLRGSTGNPCQVEFPGVEKNIFIYFIKEKKIS